jgi:predicted ester cyclase
MPGMMREEILALVQRRRTAYSASDAAALAATHAEKGVVISPFGGVLEGRAEIERVYRLWFSAFTDMTFTDDDIVIDGDRVVLIGRLAGTHAGDFFGLAPTGRRIEVQAAQVMKVADGLVVEERRIYDFTGVLIQVGVLRAKPIA